MTTQIDVQLVGIWFMGLRPALAFKTMEDGTQSVGSDWKLDLREEQPGSYRFQYRFRYYHRDTAKDEHDKDEFSWFSHRDPWVCSSRQAAIEKCRRFVGLTNGVMGLGPTDEILMTDAGVADFANRLSQKPWVRTRIEVNGIAETGPH